MMLNNVLLEIDEAVQNKKGQPITTTACPQCGGWQEAAVSLPRDTSVILNGLHEAAPLLASRLTARSTYSLVASGLLIGTVAFLLWKAKIEKAGKRKWSGPASHECQCQTCGKPLKQ